MTHYLKFNETTFADRTFAISHASISKKVNALISEDEAGGQLGRFGKAGRLQQISIGGFDPAELSVSPRTPFTTRKTAFEVRGQLGRSAA